VWPGDEFLRRSTKGVVDVAAHAARGELSVPVLELEADVDLRSGKAGRRRDGRVEEHDAVLEQVVDDLVLRDAEAHLLGCRREQLALDHSLEGQLAQAQRARVLRGVPVEAGDRERGAEVAIGERVTVDPRSVAAALEHRRAALRLRSPELEDEDGAQHEHEHHEDDGLEPRLDELEHRGELAREARAEAPPGKKGPKGSQAPGRRQTASVDRPILGGPPGASPRLWPGRTCRLPRLPLASGRRLTEAPAGLMGLDLRGISVLPALARTSLRSRQREGATLLLAGDGGQPKPAALPTRPTWLERRRCSPRAPPSCFSGSDYCPCFATTSRA